MQKVWAYAPRIALDSGLGLSSRAQLSCSCRSIFSTIVVSALSFFSSPPSFAETTNWTAVEFALDACAQLPDRKERILSELGQNGWVRAENFNTLYDLFASTTFAFKHSTENTELLENSFANAFFMSASVLGNSALPKNQPAFVHDDVSIGIIGLTLSKSGLPYCVINGPSALFEVFAKKINLTPSKMTAHGFLRNPEGQIHKGKYYNTTVSVTTIDLDSILLRGREFGLGVVPYTSDITLELAIERFRPFNAYISPQNPAGGN